MKKILLIIVLSALTLNTIAQDTIKIDGPLPNYYCQNWSNVEVPAWGTAAGGYKSSECLKKFYSTDTLQIYGVAIVLFNTIYEGRNYPLGVSEYNNYLRHLYDTSFTECYEYVNMYTGIPNTSSFRRVNQQLLAHYQVTPFAYYFNIETLGFPPHPVPVFELYYDSAINVTDTFWVGSTTKTASGEYYEPTINGITYWNYTWPLNYFIIQGGNDKIIARQEDIFSSDSVWNYYPTSYTYFIFPILTPNPDTNTAVDDSTGHAVVEDSTLSVRQADLVGRYVQVLPNPASDRVQVSSSFEITEIEIFDSEGKLVCRERCQGLSKSMDVHALPRGMYVMQIATPSGSCTKKLLLR